VSRTFGSCAAVCGHLNAFADGELRGDLLREVSSHLESCVSCASSVDEITQLGSLLRDAVNSQAETPDLAGLADGVVSRIRAEEHESWRGILERATGDLHWALVGVGAVVAAFISVLIVSGVVQSGVGRRGDSLAAMLNTLAATPPPALGRSTDDLAALGIDNLTLASLAEVNDAGHVAYLHVLSGMNEREAAIILTEVRRMKFAEQPDQDRRMTDPTGRQVVLLFSTTQVRGKVL
jgi:predicted anti-sigma-YlaC factor YlaD